MRFASLFSFLRQRRDPRLLQRQRKRRASVRPQLERLEVRELPAGVPLITAVTPPDGSTTFVTTPALQVTFNEDVTGANNAANYSLFDSSGNAITVNSVAYSHPSGGPFQATLTYNSGQALDAGAYTLFIRGDKIVDASAGSTLTLAQPGQVVVANSGKTNIATMAMPGTGTLSALSNYALPPNGATQSKPSDTVLADVTGDGLADLLVLDAGASTIDIYKGQSSGVFNLSPDATLSLPAGSGASAMITGDFNLDKNLDIAVTNSSLGTVSVFLNTGVNPGDLFFGPATNSAVGPSPSGIVAADFNGDGNLDLAVSNGGTATDLDGDSINDYYVSILPGTASGAFGAAVNVKVGDVGNPTASPVVPPSGLSKPTGIAAGLFNGDNLMDLAVSGGGGVAALANTSAGGTVTFASTLLTTPDTTSVAAGVIRNTSVANPRADIVATTGTTTGQVLVLVNSNTGIFAGPAALPAGASPTSVTIADLDGDKLNDILVTNNAAAGQLTVLRNSSRSGSITGTSASGTSPITVNSTGHGLANGNQVAITGVLGNTAANGFFTLAGVTANSFNLVGTTANATYGGGGTWNFISFANAITGASSTANQPITITSANHGLTTGQQVTVVGVGGNTAANGTFFVKVVDANSFQLLGTTPNANYTAGTGTWTRPPLPVDSNPVALALGDINQDGKLDVVTANNAGQDVSILRGNGDGSFQASANLTVTPATQPNSVVVGDVNADGLPDLVVADGGSNQVSIFLAAASGVYKTPVVVSTLSTGVGRTPVSLALADLTGSGKLDIIAVSQADSVVTILANNGTGTFSVFGTAATGNSPVKVVVADFNGDGKLDLAVAHTGSGGGGGKGGGGGGGVSILLGNGNRTFQNSTELSFPGNNGNGGKGGGGPGQNLTPSALAAADFNKDGNLDLVVADNNAPGRVALELGDGTGGFVHSNYFSVGVNPTALAVADFNDDGFPDVVTVSSSVSTANNISVLINAAGGGFSPFLSTTIANGVSLRDVTTANVNQDPFPDLIVTAAPGIITAASNASPIVITSANHGLQTGAQVTISGVGGDTAANGTWTITVLDNNRFSLNGSTGNAAYTSGGVFSLTPAGAINNVFTLKGIGNGTFQTPVPYQAGGSGAPSPFPSYVAVVSDPFRRVTTFTIFGTTVNANLVRNGDFESIDLSGEQGNLNGWTTYDLAGSPGSRGRWMPQSGTTSPLSNTTVTPSSSGTYQAMLDQENLSPFSQGQGGGMGMGGNIPGTSNSNTQDTYQGSHALYQDITIPAGATSLTVSFSLYINNTGGSATGYSDTTATPQLNFQSAADNQQVRVDLMNPLAAPLETAANNTATNTNGVYQNLFITAPGQANTQTITQTITLDPTVYGGKTVRLRFAATNNRGLLIVGVDNVKLQARFIDTVGPTLSGLRIRNPSSLASPSLQDPTTDPTIIGTLGDNGSINNVTFIEVDPKNDGFGQIDDTKITSWDANGNFTFTLPTTNLLPGVNSVTIRAVDKAGNQATSSVNFTLQGPSDVAWSAQGPDAINVTDTGVNYSTVSGDITAIAVDPRDPTSNTYYVGAANGGIWKTTDGGNDWKVLTDGITDASGLPVAAAIGGMALGIKSSAAAGQPNSVIYAATGLSDNSLPSLPGVGLLKSIDDGATWTLVGQSVLGGARVSKVVIDPTNINTVYVAVTSFVNQPKGPALLKSTDGGLTWVNVLIPVNMYLPGHTTTLAANTAMASVTDLVLDPFTSNRLLVGLGNIGQAAASSTGGVWLSTNGGITWDQVVGGITVGIPNGTIPSGTGVGRVTIAVGGGRVGDEKYVYVMVGNPPPTTPATNTFDQGTFQGLFRSKDNMLNFTKVMLRQNAGTKGNENFVDINLLGHDASDVGAMVVDINNPNVVYIGGSRQFTQPNDAPTHGVIRVDTGNMRDTTYKNSGNAILNDGEDITKAYIASNPPAPTLAGPNRDAGFYDTSPTGAAYKGEGVYWYDLEEAGSGTQGSQLNLPNAIHALMFDGQGRLLFGTQNGIYRGIAEGFSYDFSSGGTGISTDLGGLGMGNNGGGGKGGGSTTSTIGMRIIAINGNLQITELTSVALGPTDPTQLYSSQFGSGTALTSSGQLGWVSGGTTGPSDALNGNLGVTNATFVRIAAPDPSAASGTPNTVFRVWQAAVPGAVFPEISTDGGSNFTPVALAGINTADAASLSPAFAINPNKVIVGGLAADQLLFGTQNIYLTSTSTNVWDVIPGSPVLTGTAYYSALAFAPANPGLYYAGTTDGRIFVGTPDGKWMPSSTGLPGIPGSATAPRINSIVVDPTNGAVAYALIAGNGFAHVFKTSNGGATWSPSNKLVGGGTLPDVSAFSMVIDPTSVSGAPSGRYYLGTAVGVYASLDKGATWQRFGQGLPAVPVVDLQFSSINQLLVAATQGRGVFEISTRANGPQVTAYTPTTPMNQALSQLTVTFNEAVDARNFTVNNNVTARTSLVSSLLNSDSYRQSRVVSLYQQYLRRTPMDNVQAAVTLLQQQGEEQVIASLVSSAEYFANPALGNNSNATWVNAIYIDLLHRTAAGDAGATNQINALNANTITLLQVATSVVTSNEFRADEVALLYNQILGRNKSVPASQTDPDIAPWLAQFAMGARLESLMATLFGSQEFYFNNDGVYPTGSGTGPVATALASLTGNKDSNGTPILDLIVADKTTNNVKVYKGLAGGGYASGPTVTLTLPAGAAPRGIAVEDFNNDGNKDVAVVNSGTDNVTVFLNNSSAGGLSFASTTGTSFSVVAGSGPVAIVAAKINADSNIDLAVVSSKAVASKFNVNILAGTGTGSFGAPTVIDSGFTVPLTGLAVGDVNSDNNPDLVVSANDGSGTGGVRLLRATGNLVYTGTSLSATPATAVALGKIDTNASLDVVAIPASGNNILVMQNQGGSPVVFGAAVQFAAGTLPTAVAIGDINGDGRNDILVTNGTAPGGLTTLLNTTTAATSGFDTISFGTAVTYPVPSGKPVSVALADTNQDLILDAVMAVPGNDSVYIMKGTNLGSFMMPTDERFVTSVFKRLQGITPDIATLNADSATLGTSEQSRLTGPGGSTVPLSIVETDSSTHLTFQLTFVPQTVDGTYTLTLGPNTLQNPIKDFVDVTGTYQNLGLALNQNNNQVNGEFPADRFLAQFAINTSDDGKFVSGLYHDLLGSDPSGRQVDTPGFIGALTPVDAARFAALAGIAPAFTTSSEYRSNLVQSYYTKYLRRSPAVGSTEVQGWVTSLNMAQNTEEGIIAAFVSSQEYFQNPTLGNNNNTTWLSQVYTDLLGHSPASDPNSAAYLAGLTAGTLTRLQVASTLVSSDEFLRGVVFSDFSKLLGRAPTDSTDPSQSELHALLPILRQTAFAAGGPSPDEQLIDAIAASQEYFQRVGNDTRSWSASMYTRVLGRAAINSNGPEVNNLLVYVLGSYGGARQGVITNLEASTEYKSRLVNSYYTGHLGRSASTAEISAWLNMMPMMSDDQVLANVVSSTEYFPTTGGGSSNAQWLDKLYNDLLKRTSAGDALATTYLNQLNVTPTAQILQARISIALAVIKSAEYRRIQVAGFFNKYLGRSKSIPPLSTDPDLVPWVNALLAGATQEQVLVGIIGSAEYMLVPHAFP